MPDTRVLISNPADLKPSTAWNETVWAYTSEEELVDHTTKARLCVATLLPFKDQKPDWDGFTKSVRWMQQCAAYYGVEMVFVLNADTGYIFDLDNDLYAEVLKRFRAEFPEQRFIAGVTARGTENDSAFKAERYWPLLDIAQEHDNCEMMIMTSKLLNTLDNEPRRDAYFQIAEHLIRPGIAHALEPSFVPWATPFDPWLFHEIAMHPTYVGGKVSTLDEPHHGDCCVHDSKIYVATQNRTKERRGVFINVYSCDDLRPAGEFPIDFPFEGGIDGITYANGFFYVGEGKPKESEQPFNWVHKFTPDFVAVEKIKVPGQTSYGIQTITFAHGFFWLGTYSKDRTYQCDPDFKLLTHHNVDISVGGFALPEGPGGEPRLMVARNIKKENGLWTASAAPAVLKDGRLVTEK